MGKMDSSKGIPLSTGDKLPKGADMADASGERREKLVGGVAMGKMDGYGPDHQFNTGRTSGICYTHDRSAYKMEDKED